MRFAVSLSLLGGGSSRLPQRGPHSHILMTGGGPSDLFGSEILAKSDFFLGL